MAHRKIDPREEKVLGRRDFLGFAGFAAFSAAASGRLGPVSPCEPRRVIAHTAGGASRIATVAEARAALKLKIFGLDMDVMASKDGVLFVRHSTPGSDIFSVPNPLVAPVHTYESGELIRKGMRPLRQFFNLLNPGQRLMLDVKEPAAHTLWAIGRMLRAEPGLQQKCGLWIQHPHLVAQFARSFPHVEVGLSRDIRSIDQLPGLVDTAIQCRANAISVPVDALVSKYWGNVEPARKELERARRSGVISYVWDLADSRERHNLALKVGGIGLVSDAPELAKKMVELFENRQPELCI